jgi:hypothetical protein
VAFAQGDAHLLSYRNSRALQLTAARTREPERERKMLVLAEQLEETERGEERGLDDARREAR